MKHSCRRHIWLFALTMVVFAAVLLPARAYAACSNPSGTAGMIVYNDDYRMMQYCDDTDWIAMGPSQYLPLAVTFDGTNDYLCSNALTGTVDTRQWTGSVWFRRNTVGTDQRIYTGTSYRFSIRFTGDALEIIGNNSGGTLLLADVATIVDTDWHHLVFSVDMSDTNKRHVFLDGVDMGTGVFTTYNNGLIDFTVTQHCVGAYQDGSEKFDGDLSDLWIEWDTYVDLSQEENLRRFIDAYGSPVGLGTNGERVLGVAPDIYLSSAAAGWATNKGLAGGFTETGSLTDAATTPIDAVPDYTSSLVAHWALDEITYTSAADSSGSGLDGSLINGLDPTTDSIPGPRNTGFQFDGIDDGVFVSNPVGGELDFTGPFSISFWLKVNNASNDPIIIAKRGTTGYQFRKTAIGWFLRIDESSGNTDTVINSVVDDGQWHHIVMGRDTAQHFIYVDGALDVTTADSTVTDITDPSVFTLGNGPLYNQPLDGAMDDVRVYQRALSPKDVAALYADSLTGCNNPAGGSGEAMYNQDKNTMQFCNGLSWLNMNPIIEPKDNLVGYWKLDESSGTFVDSSGNGYDSTSQSVNFYDPTRGIKAGAAWFNTTSHNIHVNTSTDIVAGDPRTFSIWIYNVNMGGGNLGRFISTGPNELFWAGTADTIRFTADEWATPGQWENTSGTFPGDEWTHVAVSYDYSSASNDPAMYINGAPVTITEVQAPAGVRTPAGMTDLYIGNDSGGTHNAHGWLDEARVYDRVLSANEIADLYNWTGGNQVGNTTENMIGYWPLNDVSSPIVKDFAGAYDGTAYNGVVFSSAGVIGTAMGFDGVDDYVDLGDIDFSGVEFAYSAWFKTTAAKDQRILSKYNAANNQIWMMLDSAGDLECGVTQGGGARTSIKTGPYNDGNWHHGVCLVGFGQIRASGDDSVGGLTAASSVDTNDVNWQIGRRNDGAEYFQGAIDDVRLYDRSLRYHEKGMIYDAGLAGVAFDDCSNPSGSEGAMVYNTDNNVMQFCDGRNWIGIQDHLTAYGPAPLPPVITLEQQDQGTEANPSVIGFGSAPTAGNLLVVVAGHRKSTGDEALNIPGWTLMQSVKAFSSDSNNRRGIAIWAKISDGTEQNFSSDLGDDISIAQAMEFSIKGGSFNISSANSAGTVGTTSSVNTITTGTTPYISSRYSLVVAGLAIRDNPNFPSTWTNGLTVANELVTGSNFGFSVAYGLTTSPGTKEATANWTTSRDASAAIAAFGITGRTDY